MARSKHQTYRSVFGQKSKRKIDAMLEEGDEDALGLMEKRRLKRFAKEARNSG